MSKYASFDEPERKAEPTFLAFKRGTIAFADRVKAFDPERCADFGIAYAQGEADAIQRVVRILANSKARGREGRILEIIAAEGLTPEAALRSLEARPAGRPSFFKPSL